MSWRQGKRVFNDGEEDDWRVERWRGTTVLEAMMTMLLMIRGGFNHTLLKEEHPRVLFMVRLSHES